MPYHHSVERGMSERFGRWRCGNGSVGASLGSSPRTAQPLSWAESGTPVNCALGCALITSSVGPRRPLCANGFGCALRAQDVGVSPPWTHSRWVEPPRTHSRSRASTLDEKPPNMSLNYTSLFKYVLSYARSADGRSTPRPGRRRARRAGAARRAARTSSGRSCRPVRPRRRRPRRGPRWRRPARADPPHRRRESGP